MSVPYQGDGYLVPNPVIIQNPTDIDNWNSATLFTGQYELIANIGDKINQTIDGYYSIKSLFVDGIGGRPNPIAAGDGYVKNNLKVLGSLEAGNATSDGYMHVGTDITLTGTLSGGTTVLASQLIRSSQNIIADGYVRGSQGVVTGLSIGISTVAPSAGELYSDLFVIAWLRGGGASGLVTDGRNITSLTRVTTGQYTVILARGASAQQAMSVTVTPDQGGVPYFTSVTHNSATSISVFTFNSSGTAADIFFNMTVVGAWV